MQNDSGLIVRRAYGRDGTHGGPIMRDKVRVAADAVNTFHASDLLMSYNDLPAHSGGLKYAVSVADGLGHAVGAAVKASFVFAGAILGAAGSALDYGFSSCAEGMLGKNGLDNADGSGKQDRFTFMSDWHPALAWIGQGIKNRVAFMAEQDTAEMHFESLESKIAATDSALEQSWVTFKHSIEYGFSVIVTLLYGICSIPKMMVNFGKWYYNASPSERSAFWSELGAKLKLPAIVIAVLGVVAIVLFFLITEVSWATLPWSWTVAAWVVGSIIVAVILGGLIYLIATAKSDGKKPNEGHFWADVKAFLEWLANKICNFFKDGFQWIADGFKGGWNLCVDGLMGCLPDWLIEMLGINSWKIEGPMRWQTGLAIVVVVILAALLIAGHISGTVEITACSLIIGALVINAIRQEFLIRKLRKEVEVLKHIAKKHHNDDYSRYFDEYDQLRPDAMDKLRAEKSGNDSSHDGSRRASRVGFARLRRSRSDGDLHSRSISSIHNSGNDYGHFGDFSADDHRSND